MAFDFPLFSVLVAFSLCYVPHVIRVRIGKKFNTYNHTNPRDTAKFTERMSPAQADLQRRLLGAHNNQLESIGMYAAGIVANIARKPNDWLIHFLSAFYVMSRIVYIMVYMQPQVANGYLRTFVFGFCFFTIFAVWIRAFV